MTGTNDAFAASSFPTADFDDAPDHEEVPVSEIAVGVVIGRTSEYFDFFVYAIASVVVFPRLVWPHLPAVEATIYSFIVFALGFVARPVGTLIFTALDRIFGRVAKLTIALFLLGTSTAVIAFLPGAAVIGEWSAVLLCLIRFTQGIALGGSWDGLPTLLALSAPPGKKGLYAMVPQLGAPIGLLVAAGLFAFFEAKLSDADFMDWGWRYPFCAAFAINVVALFSRLRIVATAGYQRLFKARELQPSAFFPTIRAEAKILAMGSLAPLASFALFHLVTVFPLSWTFLFDHEPPQRFLVIEMVGALVGIGANFVSVLIVDRVGRRRLLFFSSVLIALFSAVAPMLLGGDENSQVIFMLVGFVLLGLSFGQSAGSVITSNLPIGHRYTGAAIIADLAWLFGAGFAPLASFLLADYLGLQAAGFYLLSGALCSLGVLWVNKEMARRLQ